MKQRTMNITRNIICILGLLTLIILIKPTKVCAFSMNDAKSSPVLNSGKYRTSRLRDEYDVKLFQVKMPERGYFRITLRPDAFANLDDIVDGWNFSIYRKDDLSDPVASYWEIETKMSTEKLVLAKGTYYIAVESWSSYEAPRACFNIKADIVSDNSWEKENNDTLKKADAITIGKKYQGTLFDNMDEDCFKVTAPNTGKITATLQCDPDTDVNYIEDGWNMAIYSANNSEDPIIKEEGIVTKGSIKFNVTKGKTYYIHVYNYDLGAPLGYVYHLSTSFKGPKVTSVKKNTTTAKKTVKMVTGVSLKVKKKKINIHFKLISNVSKYQIMYSTKKSFKNKKVATAKSGNVTIKKLKRKKTYFVRIRAISKNGKAGAWSVVKKVRVK